MPAYSEVGAPVWMKDEGQRGVYRPRFEPIRGSFLIYLTQDLSPYFDVDHGTDEAGVGGGGGEGEQKESEY
jgi:hypothetical protein